jgi:hypothetical protein
MYVSRNIEARSRNHFFRGNAISTAYVCVHARVVRGCVWMRGFWRVSSRVALPIQHAKLMRHIVICGLSDSTKFFHIIS